MGVLVSLILLGGGLINIIFLGVFDIILIFLGVSRVFFFCFVMFFRGGAGRNGRHSSRKNESRRVFLNSN